MKTRVSSWLLVAGLAACSDGTGGGSGGAGTAGGEPAATTTTTASIGSTSGGQGGGSTTLQGAGGAGGAGATGGAGGSYDEDGPDPLCNGEGGSIGSACAFYRAQYCEVKEALGCLINGGLAFPCDHFPDTCGVAVEALYACQQEATTETRCRCHTQGEGGDIYQGAMDCDEDVACQDEIDDLAACQKGRAS